LEGFRSLREGTNHFFKIDIFKPELVVPWQDGDSPIQQVARMIDIALLDFRVDIPCP